MRFSPYLLAALFTLAPSAARFLSKKRSCQQIKTVWYEECDDKTLTCPRKPGVDKNATSATETALDDQTQKWQHWINSLEAGGECGGSCGPTIQYKKIGYAGMSFGRECTAARAWKKPGIGIPAPAYAFKRDDFHDCNVYCDQWGIPGRTKHARTCDFVYGSC